MVGVSVTDRGRTLWRAELRFTRKVNQELLSVDRLGALGYVKIAPRLYRHRDGTEVYFK